MTLYQLFTKNPTDEMMNKILECFEIKDLEDTVVFTRKDLVEKNIRKNYRYKKGIRSILFTM